MTFLYRLNTDAPSIATRFGASQAGDQWAGGHVTPSGFAPIVTGGREFITGPRREFTKARMIPRVWGVPPPPNAHNPTHGITNVRNPDSPFWIGNLRNSEFRCLIPATSFMEWGKGTDKDGRRIQHWFAPSDQPLFAMAGVWKDSEVPSFALLTCEANAILRRAGHERMPVILPPSSDATHSWMYKDWRTARKLIQPYSSSLMRDLTTTDK